MVPFNSRKGRKLSSKAIADATSWYCSIVLVALILLTIYRDSYMIPNDHDHNIIESNHFLLSKPCDEIYVVGEGETLNTISDKCNDPFIVENNPHIHDPDDVFPGLVIKITPSYNHT
ncbi:putative LysM domain-containing protein [Medicago truncatula]|uniref:Peptidoglycan-binding LysM domain protein n=1 Tax=Medicago truncatula TaxID=3880 RepID=A0A072TZM0_MEDTR|nr:uncharacterized protein LOC25500969 [Medicago truncatula]KEH18985.1 peptidoglycan-binding LysM domain protein [Medicago truncatula]RHN40078.1 putative LysM domain-containing protein [Medicago truncatula]